MSCERCETLPPKSRKSGNLYVVPAIAVTDQKIRDYFTSAFIPFSDSDGLLQAKLTGDDLSQFCTFCHEQLNRGEMEGSRALLVAPDTEPRFSDLLRMESLLQLVTKQRGEWLLDLLSEKRVYSVFHPIRPALNPSAIFAHEALLRGKDEKGNPINPGVLFSTARDADILFYLDREARFTAVKSAGSFCADQKVFINFNPTSIYSPDNCLKSTIALLQETPLRPENVVFEIVESDYIEDLPKLLSIVEYYRREGFKVALDDLGAGYGSLQLMSQLKPDYVKLDMDLVRGVSSDQYKAAIARNILQLSRELQVTTVAEGIETEEDLTWMQDSGVDLVQGFLWGKPEPIQ